MIGFVSEAQEASGLAQVRVRRSGRHLVGLLVAFVLAFPVDANANAVAQAVKVHDPTQDAQKASTAVLHPLPGRVEPPQTN